MTAPTSIIVQGATLDELVDRVAERVVELTAERRPTAEPAPYLSTPAMAERLSISRAKLHALAGEPGCPVIWVGDARRWPPAETIAWFRERGRVGK